MLKRLLRKIEQLGRKRQQKQEKAKRDKLRKEALHEFGWEIRCDCGKLHNADKAGRVFADSATHWHTICECGKKSKFLTGAPVLIADGVSDLKVLKEFYILHETRHTKLYSISERREAVAFELVRGAVSPEKHSGKYEAVIKFYDYETDDLIGETTYDSEEFSPTYYHYMHFCSTRTVSSNKYLVVERFESHQTKDNKEEHW